MTLKFFPHGVNHPLQHYFSTSCAVAMWPVAKLLWIFVLTLPVIFLLSVQRSELQSSQELFKYAVKGFHYCNIEDCGHFSSWSQNVKDYIL